MREHEAGRSCSPWRWHPWFRRISNVAAQLSAASLLASGMARSLAAHKHKSRNDDRGGRDKAERDRDDGGHDRNREDKGESDSKEDRRLQRENSDRWHGDGDGGNSHQGRKHEHQDDALNDASSGATKKQKFNQTTEDPGATDGNEVTTSGGNGGSGDGGGNDPGNAGSGFFDSPLATKARRRANDFDNANRDEDDQRIIVDVDPEGESVYETDSILFVTGPEGVEIQTDNISYFAEPTPTPEPLPGLELSVREPGFPFGEDFPFGDTTVAGAPTASEPADPGDTGAAPAPMAKPIPSSDQPEPANSDGGDYTMDFAS